MCVNQSTFPHKATLFHVLNNSAAFLGEGERMTWCHDSILNYMTHALKENKPEHNKIFADLPDHNINGSTIPPNITVTSSRPDLVIVDSSSSPQTVYLYELTVCFERTGNLEAANSRKYSRYTGLASDIEDNGYSCKNIPFEVGSRGHLTPDNRSRLSILHNCVPLQWSSVDSAKTLLRRAYFALILYISQEMILGREQSFLCQLDSSYEYEYETILYTWKCSVKMKTNSSAWAAVTAQVTNLPPDLNAIVCRLLSIYLLFSINWFSLLW